MCWNFTEFACHKSPKYATIHTNNNYIYFFSRFHIKDTNISNPNVNKIHYQISKYRDGISQNCCFLIHNQKQLTIHVFFNVFIKTRAGQAYVFIYQSSEHLHRNNYFSSINKLFLGVLIYVTIPVSFQYSKRCLGWPWSKIISARAKKRCTFHYSLLHFLCRYHTLKDGVQIKLKMKW